MGFPQDHVVPTRRQIPPDMPSSPSTTTAAAADGYFQGKLPVWHVAIAPPQLPTAAPLLRPSGLLVPPPLAPGPPAASPTWRKGLTPSLGAPRMALRVTTRVRTASIRGKKCDGHGLR